MAPQERRGSSRIVELEDGGFEATVYVGLDPVTKEKRYLRSTVPTRDLAEMALDALKKQVPGKERRRGSIETLPSGSFRAVVYAGVDPLTKKARYLRETHARYEEAEKAVTRLQHQVDERRHPRSAITIGEIIERWQEVAGHEQTTRERNSDLIRLYITPTFGSMPGGKLDSELLERYYARLAKCRELCNGRRRGHDCRPLANNTIRKIHFILRAALGRAVKWKYLSVNEAAMAEPPTFDPGEPDPPSAQEAARLLNEAWRDPAWGLLLWLAMVTGSRRGEICGIRWRHIDWDRAVLHLERSHAHTKNGIIDKETKTRQKRRIALDSYTLGLLKAHQQQCEEASHALGSPLSPDAFIFASTPDGSTALQPHSVSQRYRRLAIRLNLTSPRLHALRHYSATELLSAGVDLRTVSGRIGHASGGATALRFYAAWVEEVDRKAADTIADIVPRPDPALREPRSPYEKVAAQLRADVTTGRLSPGDYLPTVIELANTHQVSVGTAHRAIALLRAEGLITVRRGKRATVTDPHAWIDSANYPEVEREQTP